MRFHVSTAKKYAFSVCHLVLMVVSAIVVVVPLSAQAQQSPNPEREFIMSCTYGVLAGTLVGAASLAFVDKPGDNLQRVARGASLGLYMGIALGAYTVYILPGQIELEEERRLDPDSATDGVEGEETRNFHVFPFIAGGNANGNADGAGMGLVYSF